MTNLPEIEPQPEEGARSVLVVEDDALIRTGLADELRDVGLHVVEAANADEAWTYLETGAPVDLIFSDVQMPGSMNGLDLAQMVKESYPNILFILTSGKPYEHQLVLNKIKQSIAARERKRKEE